MTQNEQKKAATKFTECWKNQGYEKGQSQQFWIDLLVSVFGVQDIKGFISFEDQVQLEAYGFWGKLNSESECVATLMQMYQELVCKGSKR